MEGSVPSEGKISRDWAFFVWVDGAKTISMQKDWDSSRLVPISFYFCRGCAHRVNKKPDLARGPARRNALKASYGVTFEMRVPQLPRLVRVAPQLPNGAVMYSARLQVWLMYSLASQMLLPSATAAP